MLHVVVVPALIENADAELFSLKWENFRRKIFVRKFTFKFLNKDIATINLEN